MEYTKNEEESISDYDNLPSHSRKTKRTSTSAVEKENRVLNIITNISLNTAAENNDLNVHRTSTSDSIVIEPSTVEQIHHAFQQATSNDILHDSDAQMAIFGIGRRSHYEPMDLSRLRDLTNLFSDHLKALQHQALKLNKSLDSLMLYFAGTKSLNVAEIDPHPVGSFIELENNDDRAIITRFLLKSLCAQYVLDNDRHHLLLSSPEYGRIIQDLACSMDLENANGLESIKTLELNCKNLRGILQRPPFVGTIDLDSFQTTDSFSNQPPLQESLINYIVNDQLRSQSKALFAQMESQSHHPSGSTPIDNVFIPPSPIKLYADELAFPSMLCLGDDEFLLSRLLSTDHSDTAPVQPIPSDRNLASSTFMDDHLRLSEVYGPYIHLDLSDVFKPNFLELQWNARYRVVTSLKSQSISNPMAVNNTQSHTGNSKRVRMYGLTNAVRKDSNEGVQDRFVPVNPYRTHSRLRGRGILPLWGPNYMYVLFAWYWNKSSNQAEVILMRDPSSKERVYSLPKGVPHFLQSNVQQETNPEDAATNVMQQIKVPPKLRELWIKDILRCERNTSQNDDVQLNENDVSGLIDLALSGNQNPHEQDKLVESTGYVVHPLNTENAWVEAIITYVCVEGFETILASPTPTTGFWNESYFTFFPVIDCSIALSPIDRQITLGAIVDKYVYRPSSVN